VQTSEQMNRAPTDKAEVTAFRFAKSYGADSSSDVGTISISVSWASGIETQMPVPAAFRTSLSWNATNGEQAAIAGEKTLKSEVGNMESEIERAKSMWQEGEKISKIVVRYRSAAGLLSAGVLTGSSAHSVKRRRESSASASSMSVVDLTDTKAEFKPKNKRSNTGVSSQNAIAIKD